MLDTRRRGGARILLSLSLALTAATQSARSAGEATPAIPSDAVVRDEVRSMRDGLSPLIVAAQQKFGIPGISLTLVRGTEVLWSEGFGYADLDTSEPAGPGTIYRAGSLAKPFTAIAVMQLSEAGEIDIDQPLNGYLPAFSIRSRFDTAGDPITVRSALCHHSGLPTDLNKGMWTSQPFTEVAAQLREEYTAFPPNLVFSYSNVGYTLLGHMVEAVSEMRYDDFMAQRVFRPLGMRRSWVGNPTDSAPHVARGYRNGRPLQLLPIRDTPALGLHTSAEDLGRFMGSILGPEHASSARMLQPESLEELFEPQNLDVPLDLDILNGLGWFLEDGTIPGGGKVLRHGGTTLAFGSEVIMLPEHGLGVAVLANADGSRGIVFRLAEEILARVLKATPEPLPAGLFLADLERTATEHRPAETAGNYATDFGLISIRPTDAKLCACMVEETVDLIPYPNGWFGLGPGAVGSLPPSFKPLAEMRFQTREIDGREVVLAQKGEKQIVLGEKVPETPIPDVWLQRVGRYELMNPDPGYPLTEPTLKLREGQLCMSYKMPMLSGKTIQVPLRPVSDTEAIILGLGRTRGETLRTITVDGEERLRYSGFVGRRIQGSDEP